MRTWAKQHSLVFFLGFSIFVVALGYGVLAQNIFSTLPLPFLLRGMGIGMMAGGLALWAAENRYEGGKPGINPLIGALVGIGVLCVVVAAFFLQQPPLGPLIWAGIGINVVALLVGAIAMLVNPAYPEPITVSWPEGGEPPAPEPHEHHEEEVVEVDAQAMPDPEDIVEPDNLTRVEGIGPKLQSILNDAGIMSFEQLAETSADELTTIVKAADFKAPFKADTWPEQAALAAAGDWDALDTLQDELQGGRR